MPSDADHRRVRWRYPDAPPGTCRGCGKQIAGRPTRRTHAKCAAEHRAKADHRGELERRGPLVCIDRGREGKGPCQGPIESDHVVPLGHNGPHDWNVPRCKKHHQEKTNADRARYGPTRRSYRMPQTKPTRAKAAASDDAPAPGGAFRKLAAVGVAGTGVCWLFLDRPVFAALFAAGSLASAVAAGRAGGDGGGTRTGQRADLEREFAHALAKETRTVPEDMQVRITRIRKGHPVAGWARYASTFDDRPQSTDREAIEDWIEHKTGWTDRTGEPLTFDWQPHRFRVAWRIARNGETVPDRDEPDDVEEVDADSADLIDVITGDLNESYKTDEMHLAIAGRVDDQGPTVLKLHYPARVKARSDEVRWDIHKSITVTTGLRWTDEWDYRNRVATFTRRPPMPFGVTPPVTAAALADTSTWRLRYGVGEGGTDVVWNLKVSAHALGSGSTGSGKTYAIRNLALDAARRGFLLYACDPKRVELMGMRGYPNVVEVATDIEDMIDLVERMHALMDERYAQVEARQVKTDDLQPVLFIVDELHEWIERANAWWKANKPRGASGSEHPAVEKWRSIGRLGRTARIHMLIGIQDPAADVFGGTGARDQYRFRFALGALDHDGARKMFGRSDVGRDVPEDPKGRATVALTKTTIVEAQGYATPDPGDEDLDADARALLAALRPRVRAEGAPEPRARQTVIDLSKLDDVMDIDDEDEAPAFVPRAPRRWVVRNVGQLTEDDMERDVKIDGVLAVITALEEHRDGTEVSYTAGGKEHVVVFSNSDTVEVYE